MPAGRPTGYDPSYCDRVIELGRSGMSVVEMAADIGVSRNTLETNWPKAHPQFMEALEEARDLAQAWWERQGRENLTTGGFQSALYSRSMAARFPRDWREVKGTELTGKDGGPVSVTEVKRVIVDPNAPTD
jgi:hypothetical protein